MGVRNFGIGSRNMGRAGQMILNTASQQGAISFSSADVNGERWGQFACKGKELGISKMEQVTIEKVIQYGQGLGKLVEAGDMAASTAQNYVSAINTVMKLATQGSWKSVSPTRDCGIPARSGIATENQSISQMEHARLKENLCERLSALIDVQRALGLRFAESAKLDARQAAKQARETGTARIARGTKGRLERDVPVLPEALPALERAAAVQGHHCSLIPPELTYAQFQTQAYRELGAAMRSGFHGERRWYAQERYRTLAGAPAPVVMGWSHAERFERLSEYLKVSIEEAKEIDRKARLIVANELGHHRMEVTNEYLG